MGNFLILHDECTALYNTYFYTQLMIEYQYNPGMEILEVYYEGNLEFSEYEAYIQAIAENKKLPRKLKILTDARTANYTFAQDDIFRISDLLMAFIHNYEYVIIAMIHAKPAETAASMLFNRGSNSPKFRHEIFNTRQAALNWLNIW